MVCVILVDEYYRDHKQNIMNELFVFEMIMIEQMFQCKYEKYVAINEKNNLCRN